VFLLTIEEDPKERFPFKSKLREVKKKWHMNLATSGGNNEK
jgi:hypothetical protein